MSGNLDPGVKGLPGFQSEEAGIYSNSFRTVSAKGVEPLLPCLALSP